MSKYIITHDGVFHADESMAVALLLAVYGDKEDLDIVRTRDIGRISELQRLGGYTVDVGGEYDYNRLFDHHQGVYHWCDTDNAMSSAGMVLSHLKDTDKISSLFADLLYEEVVRWIDKQDTGGNVAGFTFSNYISTLNCDDIHDDDAQYVQFMYAVEACINVIRRYHKKAKSVEEALVMLSECDCVNEGTTFVLPKFTPGYLKALEVGGMLDKDFRAVWPDGDQFVVRAVPADLKDRSSIKPIPQEHGLSDVIFVHQAGFIAKTKTLDAAIDLANKY